VTKVAGAVTTNFNDGLLPANYSGGLVVTGSVPGQYATPPMTNLNTSLLAELTQMPHLQELFLLDS
jgi:hypothetical protein